MAFTTLEFPKTDNKLSRLIGRLSPLLDMQTGPWIAGGSLRRLLVGETDLEGFDIDIFVRNPLEFTKFQDALCSILRLRYLENKSIHMNEVKRSGLDIVNKKDVFEFDNTAVVIQIIRTRYFETAEQLINDFDFTVCMAATDGRSIIMDDRMMPDIKARRLRLHNGERRPQTLIRLAKYTALGFVPDPGVVAHMFHMGDIEKTMDSELMVHAENY